MSRTRWSGKRIVRIVRVCKIDGGVSRFVRFSDGSGRIETWTPGVGWLPSGARATELFPPSCAPVTAELVARMGIPPEDVIEGPVAH